LSNYGYTVVHLVGEEFLGQVHGVHDGGGRRSGEIQQQIANLKRLNGCYTEVTRLLHGCCTVVTRLLHEKQIANLGRVFILDADVYNGLINVTTRKDNLFVSKGNVCIWVTPKAFSVTSTSQGGKE
jgi:hypothetical protein